MSCLDVKMSIHLIGGLWQIKDANDQIIVAIALLIHPTVYSGINRYMITHIHLTQYYASADVLFFIWTAVA